MKNKLLIFSMLVIMLFASGCNDDKKSIEQKNVEDNTKEEVELTLDDFPVIKEKVESIVSELKESEWFTILKFSFVDRVESTGTVYVSYDVGINIPSPTLTFYFNNDDLEEIVYNSYNETYTQIYNRRMALNSLSIVNISERSFDNSKATRSYETFKHIVDGSNCETWAITKDNKSVMCAAIGNGSYKIDFD